MDPGTVITGIVSLVKLFQWFKDNSSGGAASYTKEYKDNVLMFKGVNSRGALAAEYAEWYWIEDEKDKKESQSIFQDIYFYIPIPRTTAQENWLQNVQSKDTVTPQDFLNWFEMLEDSTNINFKNMHLLKEIVERKTFTQVKAGAGFPTAVEVPYLRKRAHIALYNDGQRISDSGMAQAEKLGVLEQFLVPNKFQGYLTHEGSGKYIVALNAASAPGTQMILFQDHPSTFNKMALTHNGYLYHYGAKKFVVPNGVPGPNTRTPLVLSSTLDSTFNQFELTAEGYLRHRKSGWFVVAQDAKKDNYTQLSMANAAAVGANKTFNKVKFTG